MIKPIDDYTLKDALYAIGTIILYFCKVVKNFFVWLFRIAVKISNHFEEKERKKEEELRKFQ